MSANPSAIEAPLPESEIKDLLRAEFGNRAAFDELDFYQTDIFYESSYAPLARVRVASAAQVQKLVALARELGLALAPLGAGLSYSAGYIPRHGRTVMVDLTDLNRIIEVNARDRYVTVEAGVTWEQLRQALDGTGLRPPFWGTFSGRLATVGGGLSQGAKFYGSGNRGTSGDSVIGLKVVTGEGELLTTGSAASLHSPSPFYRYYGPDLTGIFLADGGAFGIKVEATLQLIPILEHIETASFSFADVGGLMNAMATISGELLASEAFALDPNSVRGRLVSSGTGEDIKTLKGVVAAGRSPLEGLKNAASIALAGRRFANTIGFLLNVVTEGAEPREAQRKLARVRQIAAEGGAREVAASIPTVMRATPFPEINGLLSPVGKRINWLHTVVPNSRAEACMKATEDVYSAHVKDIEAFDITWGYLLTSNGPSGVGIETLIYWPDAPYAIHERHVGSALDDVTRHPANPNGRAAVARLTKAIIDRWSELCGVHLQIGRKYPYLATRQPQTQAIVHSLKSMLDPDNVLNPGNLFERWGEDSSRD